MEPTRRFQLLWQSQAVRLLRGEEVFSAEEPPAHVLIIFEGQVSVFGELPAEPGPVLLDELGPGDCVGWSAALAGVPGVCAVATTEVDGLLIPAPAFLEITRYDHALKEAMFSKAWKAEVWRAVLSEMERRTGRVRSARQIVESLLPECVARDWPEEEAQIARMQDYVWVVVGGEGVRHGDRWNGGDGVLWARVIGLPASKLNAGLTSFAPVAPAEPPPAPAEAAPVSPATPPAPVASQFSKQSVSIKSPTSPAPSVEEKKKSWRGILTFAAVAALGAGGVAWWAHSQPILRPITLPGRLVFTGETRPLKASITGTLAEFNLRQGQRVQPGEVLAVVKPNFDEAQLRALNDTVTRARADVIFCEAFLAGVPTTETGASPQLVEMAREHARLMSDSRVHAAIVRGGGSLEGLTAAERSRVTTYFSSFKSAEDARIETVARDASTRFEELRDAESSLREAQDELRMHRQSFTGATSSDKKEAAREIADFNRVVAVLTKQVNQHQEVVNRLRREIQVMRAEVEPAVAVPIDGSKEQLTRVQGLIANVEEQFRARLQEGRKLVRESEDMIAKSRVESAPRQIVVRAPGLVSEAANLAVGAAVQPETPLAQLVTREQWQVECSMPEADLAKLKPGQAIRISYTNAAGKRGEVSESLSITGGGQPRIKLQSVHDDWREGLPVQIETEIQTGTLLNQWLGKFSRGG